MNCIKFEKIDSFELLLTAVFPGFAPELFSKFMLEPELFWLLLEERFVLAVVLAVFDDDAVDDDDLLTVDVMSKFHGTC